MPKWISVIIRLLIMGFVALMLEGCLHRDPMVSLANGYAIGAICGSCPCSLFYEPWEDERPYSDWQAVSFDGTFLLMDEATDEELEFDSETDWRNAIRRLNAELPFGHAGLEDVTGFRADDHFIIGEYESGLFLVDIDENTIETWESSGPWSAAVSQRTVLQPDDLINPKSWFVQSRHPIVYCLVGGLLIVALPWAAAPVFSKKRGHP